MGLHIRHLSTQIGHVSRALCSPSAVINMLGRSRTFPSSQKVSSRPRCSKSGLRMGCVGSHEKRRPYVLCKPPVSGSAWNRGSLGESRGSRTWCVLEGCGWGGPQILLVAAGLRAPLLLGPVYRWAASLTKSPPTPGKVGKQKIQA